MKIKKIRKIAWYDYNSKIGFTKKREYHSNKKMIVAFV